MTIYRACEIILLPEDFASAVFLPSLSKNANTKGRKMKLTEIPKESEIHPTPLPYEAENCPNCADQSSIAAPGQTTLCKTHDDERHYAEMKEFFVEECERLIFEPALPFCSSCGTEKTVVYVGIIISVTGYPLTFSFCIDCRDELTLKQNAARAASERIGA